MPSSPLCVVSLFPGTTGSFSAFIPQLSCHLPWEAPLAVSSKAASCVPLSLYPMYLCSSLLILSSWFVCVLTNCPPPLLSFYVVCILCLEECWHMEKLSSGPAFIESLSIPSILLCEGSTLFLRSNAWMTTPPARLGRGPLILCVAWGWVGKTVGTDGPHEAILDAPEGSVFSAHNVVFLSTQRMGLGVVFWFF